MQEASLDSYHVGSVSNSLMSNGEASKKFSQDQRKQIGKFIRDSLYL